MKVLSFDPIAKVGDNELLGEVLRKHINNDAIVDMYYIGVSISVDQPEDFFYRNLWETVYLRYPLSVISFDHGYYGNHINILITVGEAISFINAVTPPLFKNKIKELTSSVDEIVKSLETYLMTKNDQLEYNLSVFRKYIHLERFRENTTEYNFARMKALREFHPNGIIIDVEATNVSYTDICKGIPMSHRDTSSTTIPQVQLMINCHTKEELAEIANRISYQTSAWRVIDFFEDPEMGYFVEIFSNHYVTSDSIYPDPDCYDTCDDFFRNIIKETYKPLMND